MCPPAVRVVLAVKNPHANAGDEGDEAQEGSLEEEVATQPTLVFLPGKFHGQRSLAGYSPWGHKQLGMTE